MADGDDCPRCAKARRLGDLQELRGIAKREMDQLYAEAGSARRDVQLLDQRIAKLLDE